MGRRKQSCFCSACKMTASVALAAVCSVSAKTTTWTGAAEGDFTTAGNWNNGAPASGDTVVFSGSSGVKVTGSFDIGADGLVVENEAYVESFVDFSGVGAFTKRGAGEFYQKGAATHTGGTLLENGKLHVHQSHNKFGTNEIEVKRYSDSAPTLWLDAGWYQNFVTPIRISGAILSGDGAIRCGNPSAYLDSSITADSDFLLSVPGATGGVFIRGNVDAPGHTVNVFALAGGNWQENYVSFEGRVNAGIRKMTTDESYTWQGGNDVKILGTGVGVDHALTVDWSGRVVMGENATWEGTIVTVDGTKAARSGNTSTLALTNSANLSRLAMVSLVGGGKLDIPAGVTCQVSGLSIDGTALGEGTYSADTLPEAITGAGAIVVAQCKCWIGGTEGVLTAAENWSNHLAPAAGDVLTFVGAETITLTGAFEIPENGTLTFDHDCALNVQLALSGAGKLIKKGAGTLSIANDLALSHTGGTRVENGILCTAPFTGQSCGTGEIELVRHSDSAPTLEIQTGWYRSFPNDIRITGAITAGYGAIRCGNPNSFISGNITADSDFLITAPGGWGGAEFQGAISAPGHEVTLFSVTGTQEIPCIRLAGRVDASVRKTTIDATYSWQGGSPVELSGTGVGIDHALRHDWLGVLEMTETATWEGTNVVIDATRAAAKGQSCSLVLNSVSNLTENATVRLLGGAKMEINTPIVKVFQLWVGDEKVSNGVYTSANLPSAISGSGSLKVGTPGMIISIR